MADPAQHTGARMDAKDIVQHLRTVHFSLIAACVGLYILVTAGRSPEFDAALNQLDQIARVTAKWDEAWVQTAAEGAVPDGDFAFDQLTPVFRLEAGQAWTILPLPPALLALAGEDGTDPLDPDGPLWSRLKRAARWNPAMPQPRRDRFAPEIDELRIPAPVSLRDFEAFWNGLLGQTVGVSVAETHIGWLAGPEPAMLGAYPFGQPGPDAPVVVMRLEPIVDDATRTMWQVETEDWPVGHHFVGHVDLADPTLGALLRQHGAAGPAQETPLALQPGRPPPARPGRVETLAAVARSEHDLQTLFIEQAGVAWQPGSFAFNFPELSAVTAGNDALYLDKVRAFVESRARQAEDKVALFGIDVPLAMVSLWGGPLLLVAQFYFLLHLRSLRRILDADPAAKLAPWIGVYTDIVARGTTAATAVLLPPAALFLVARGVKDASVLESFGFVAASAALALATALCLARLWRLPG